MYLDTTNVDSKGVHMTAEDKTSTKSYNVQDETRICVLCGV